MLIEEVAKDPVGMTGLRYTPRQAVQWLAQQTVGDVTLQDIWLEGDNPETMGVGSDRLP